MSMCNALPARLPLCLAGQCSPLMGTVPTGVQISPSLSLVESQFTVLAMATSAPDTKASTLPLKRPSAPGSLSRTHTGPSIHPSTHPPIHTNPLPHASSPSTPRRPFAYPRPARRPITPLQSAAIPTLPASSTPDFSLATLISPPYPTLALHSDVLPSHTAASVSPSSAPLPPAFIIRLTPPFSAKLCGMNFGFKNDTSHWPVGQEHINR
ncbi:hypothetical protein COCC4DRAFT_130041 [Bipolaris maydis ATCC 48331]|uniref:Uncharacterized protein n=2 Tax=Cochliobolus heterostrophus TaxID=5016 RepID=M2U0V5_COCH5|nr:uncharacterized protein COCC4DRAFT_130041 [Bipolaris maydis ATCC 48331]EMD92184.1 hypothetical protein COCHEDRAFT_1029673 [Bipolaris maydis C5]ENI07875.1 hypothetical protein COCC4DRAFT_130041 [Bipolaris maydis ATCC 48331]KAJ6209988.1 hypothetical protein PSV09DRAFT_1029673 [Bipolaris maydis]